MFCTKCGKQNGPEAVYCFQCGTQLPVEVSIAAAQNLAPAQSSRPAIAEMLYAGFWKRFIAALLDSLILLIPGAIVLTIIILNASRFAENEIQPVLIGVFVNLFFVALGWLYYAGMESSANQGTLGKMALGIKVVDLHGDRISFGRASGRHFGKWVSSIIFGVGYLMAAFTERKQALHDMMASCLVVSKTDRS